MNQVLGLRPFVPARNFALSKNFYQALDFRITHEDNQIAILKRESFSFLLQNFYAAEHAKNCMVQILVRNADAW